MLRFALHLPILWWLETATFFIVSRNELPLFFSKCIFSSHINNIYVLKSEKSIWKKEVIQLPAKVFFFFLMKNLIGCIDCSSQYAFLLIGLQ